MSETIEVFVSLNKCAYEVDIWIGAPKWFENYGAFYGAGAAKHLGEMNLEHFGELTGLSLKPGQCLKIKLTAEVLEGEDGNGT